MTDPCRYDAHVMSNAFFHSNTDLTSWRTLMAYFVLSRNGGESFNKLLSLDPDTDHLRGGSSHGDNTSCVKKSTQSEQ